MTIIERNSKDEFIKKNSIIEQIRETKRLNIEELYLIVKYSLTAYSNAIMTFGFKSSISKDSLKIIKEFLAIFHEENALMKFLMKNINSLDSEAVTRFLALLEDVNDKTVTYYYDSIEAIEDACITIEEHRAVRPKKDFDTLTDSSMYREEMVSLLENMDSIKSFLGFEEDFWLYLSDKVTIVNADAEHMKDMFYAIAIFDENNVTCGIKVLAPEVVDFDSAIVAIQVYQKAYEIYKSLGVHHDNLEFSTSNELETKFQEQYIPSQTSLKLRRKNVKN